MLLTLLAREGANVAFESSASLTRISQLLVVASAVWSIRNTTYAIVSLTSVRSRWWIPFSPVVNSNTVEPESSGVKVGLSTLSYSGSKKCDHTASLFTVEANKFP